MKYLVWIILISLNTLQGQDKLESAFDFWLGNWNLKWKISDSTYQYGTNEIVKILDGTVIQENFNSPQTNFKGVSISVFNPKSRTWHQAWADNQGGYFNFTGEVDENRRIFKTLPVVKNNKTIISRMVFSNISTDHFIWDWEKSEDGGQNWSLQWRIEYQRAPNK